MSHEMASLPESLTARCGRSFRWARKSLNQAGKIWREQGAAHVVARVLSPAAKRIIAMNGSPMVRERDVLAADLTAPRRPATARVSPDRPLVVNWVTTPPSRGSGGHTTMFRLVRYLVMRGHQSRLYLYDVYGRDVQYSESVLRDAFPEIQCEVQDVLEGMADADAVFATSWPTAYPVFNDRCAGKRFYLVQDFEPFFSPHGAQSILAENTYKMTFHAITAGRWLAEKLSREYGMAADSFDFGCDVDRYRFSAETRRAGIAFYARRDAPRRAFELGTMALRLFAARRPDMEIHYYGEKIGHLPFPFVDHGLVTPDELNVIYNRCYAGLCLSMTNVSLVPYEMLAAGCLPVVNDAPHNRIVLDNPHVKYAPPTPHDLANALVAIVEMPDFLGAALVASESVRSASWDEAGRVVEQVLRRELSR